MLGLWRGVSLLLVAVGLCPLVGARPPANGRKPADGFTMVNMLTNGAVVYVVARPSTSRDDKDDVYLKLDSVKGSSSLAEELRNARVKAYGENDWRVTDARALAAQLKRMEGLTAGQLEQLVEAAKLHAQGRDRLNKGKPGDALPLASAALAIRTERLGAESPLARVSLNDVAQCHSHLRDYDKAEPAYSRSVELHKKAVGEKHPDYARVLAGLGAMYYEKGEHTRCEPLWLQVLAIRREVLGEQDEDYATTLNNLASLYASGKRRGEAERLYKQALAVRKSVLGEKHPDYADTLNSLGRVYTELGKYDAAESLLRQALAIRKAELGENHLDYAKSLNALASVSTEQERPDKAIPLLEQALAVRKACVGDQHEEYALGLNNLAWVYAEHSRDYARALPMYERAEAILRTRYGEKHPEYLTCLDNLAAAYQHLGQYPRAEELYARVVARREEALGGKHPDLAASLGHQARLYDAIGQFAKAEPLLARALAILKEAVGENDPLYADMLTSLAHHHHDAGQPGRAEPLHRRVLEVRRATAGARNVHYLIALNNLVSGCRDHHPQAEALAKEAVALARDCVGDRHYYYAIALHNLASVYSHLGQPAKAEPLLEQAARLCKEVAGEKSADYVAALMNLALHHMDLQQYPQAEPLLVQAATLAKDALGERHPFFVEVMSRLALLYRHYGEYFAAEALLRQVVKVRRETLGENHPSYAAGLHDLAMVYGRLNQPGRAAPLFRKALAIQKEAVGEDNHAYAAYLYNLGGHHYDLGEYDEAGPLLERSLAIGRRVLGDHHPSVATYLDGLATLYLAKGNTAKADPLSREALRLARTYLDQTAEAQTEQNQMWLARYFQLKLNRYLTIAQAANTPGDDVYSEVLAWKGAVWVRQVSTRQTARAIRGTESAAAAKLAAQLAAARRRLAAAALATADPTSAPSRQENLDALTQEVERLEKDLGRESAAYRDGIELRRRTAAAIRRTLPPDAVLVDYLEYMRHGPDGDKTPGNGKPCLTAFVVRRDHPTVRVELGPMADVTRAVEQWREALTTGRAVPGGPPAAEVHRLVWAPVEPMTRDAGVVLVSPDECLGRLPFAALPGRGAGRYLLEEQAVAVVPVPQLLPEFLGPRPAPEPAPSVLLLGDVEFGPAPGPAGREVFPGLPGTRDELAAIRASFEARFNGGRVTELRGVRASDAGVRREAGGHRYLHLATHGYFAEERPPSADKKPADGVKSSGLHPAALGRVAAIHPGLSCGLALAGANHTGRAGGLLTALELADLDLGGADLVTLSACGTGLGKSSRAEGLQGLQRACQVAGARTVVASLWTVDDAATKVLMTEFYTNLWGKRLGKLDALRQAQLAVLRRYDSAGGRLRGPGEERPLAPKDGKAPGAGVAPFYWAAFVLSGDWR